MKRLVICFFGFAFVIIGIVYVDITSKKTTIENDIKKHIFVGDSAYKSVKLVEQYGLGCDFDETYPRYFCSKQDPISYLPKRFLTIVIEIYVDDHDKYKYSKTRYASTFL